MHREEYLYTPGVVRSTKIDVYSFLALMKPRRQAVILELVDREAVHSQELLRRRLHQRGFETTQATISRDIKELGLVKRAGDGAYQRPGVETQDPETTLTALERAVAEFLRSVDRVQQLVVIRTGPGQAQTLAIALDRARLPEVVGTIGGDDTILDRARCARRPRRSSRVERLSPIQEQHDGVLRIRAGAKASHPCLDEHPARNVTLTGTRQGGASKKPRRALAAGASAPLLDVREEFTRSTSPRAQAARSPGWSLPRRYAGRSWPGAVEIADTATRPSRTAPRRSPIGVAGRALKPKSPS